MNNCDDEIKDTIDFLQSSLLIANSFLVRFKILKSTFLRRLKLASREVMAASTELQQHTVVPSSSLIPSSSSLTSGITIPVSTSASHRRRADGERDDDGGMDVVPMNEEEENNEGNKNRGNEREEVSPHHSGPMPRIFARDLSPSVINFFYTNFYTRRRKLPQFHRQGINLA